MGHVVMPWWGWLIAIACGIALFVWAALALVIVRHWRTMGRRHDELDREFAERRALAFGPAWQRRPGPGPRRGLR